MAPPERAAAPGDAPACLKSKLCNSGPTVSCNAIIISQYRDFLIYYSADYSFPSLWEANGGSFAHPTATRNELVMEDVRPAFKPFYQVIIGIQDSPTRPLCRLLSAGLGQLQLIAFQSPFSSIPVCLLACPDMAVLRGCYLHISG